jgi:hypothetical protein
MFSKGRFKQVLILCSGYFIQPKIVDTLASPTFWGRGIQKMACKKAANFLAKEFHSVWNH